MQRILFSTDKLRQATAAEATILCLAGWFLRHGWAVDVCARLIDGDYYQQLSRWAASGRLRIFTDDDHQSGADPLADDDADYDLLWICGGYLASGLIDRLQQGTITGRCLFQHFTASAGRPYYSGSSSENALAWRILTDSALSYAALSLRGVYAPSLRLMPLAFDDQLVCSSFCPPAGPLRKILWAGDQYCPAIDLLSQLLNMQNIRLDFLPSGQQAALLTSHKLTEYQLVIGENQLIASALCLGIPVCVAGQGGWCGYLAAGDGFQRAADSFFTASEGTEMDGHQYFDALIDGYPAAQQWAASFRDQALSRWSFSALLPPLLTTLPAGIPLTMTAAEATEWRLARNILAQQADNSRQLLQWLNHRQISETRRAVLLAVTTGHGEVASIGVIILDRRQDREACEVTLRSLEQQSLKPRHCVLISEKEYPFLSVICGEQLKMPADSRGVQQVVSGVPLHSWLIVEAGTHCLKDSLLLFADHLLQHPLTAVCYSDILQGTRLADASLVLKPDCNIDLLRSQAYPGEELLITTACLKDHLPRSPVSDELMFCELIWRVIESSGPSAIAHLPEALLLIPHRVTSDQLPVLRRKITVQHLQRCGIEAAEVKDQQNGVDQVSYPQPVRARVSIIIVTKDQQALLQHCLESVTGQTDWPDYEVLVVDNGSQQAAAREYLEQLQALQLANLRLLRWPGVFNFAAINNFAAAQASGDYLLFLNNDCQISHRDWLTELLKVAARPEVAVTGARLLYRDGHLQRAGFVTGIEQGVAGIYCGAPAEAAGYFHYLHCAQQVSAVSASCMMVRREVFDAVGGFDGVNFAAGQADVDLCLRIQQAGYLVVWTPQATLYHMGGATRLSAACYPSECTAGQQALDALRQSRKGSLCRDIRYHRHLNRSGQLFSLSVRTDRLQLPLPGRPLPVMIAGHVNFTGCGNYRVIQPYQLMEQQLQLEGGLIHGLPAAMDIAELQPDSVLLQMPFDPQVEETLRQYRQMSSAKIIMEYDDYFVTLPASNHHRHKLPKDIAGQLRRTMSLADHLVVSTPALADAYADFHRDIRVAENRLNPQQWGALASHRRQGKKLRIGWAGGDSHQGDLAIIRPLVQALQDEVEWVFMGMKPLQVRCEFHCGVPFDWYPQKLASLNLDLALVPLEINLFNECKSNLRLLELGACGVPVICSDIEPYRGQLPVTRVKNHFKHWLKAIREQLSDPQALARRGDELQRAIRRDWLLTPDNIAEWRQAWLGTPATLISKGISDD